MRDSAGPPRFRPTPPPLAVLTTARSIRWQRPRRSAHAGPEGGGGTSAALGEAYTPSSPEPRQLGCASERPASHNYILTVEGAATLRAVPFCPRALPIDRGALQDASDVNGCFKRVCLAGHHVGHAPAWWLTMPLPLVPRLRHVGATLPGLCRRCCTAPSMLRWETLGLAGVPKAGSALHHPTSGAVLRTTQRNAPDAGGMCLVTNHITRRLLPSPPTAKPSESVSPATLPSAKPGPCVDHMSAAAAPEPPER